VRYVERSWFVIFGMEVNTWKGSFLGLFNNNNNKKLFFCVEKFEF